MRSRSNTANSAGGILTPADLHTSLTRLLPTSHTALPASPQDLLATYLPPLLHTAHHLVATIPGAAGATDSEPPPSKDVLKQWKHVDTINGFCVYKLGSKDGKGAWFARRSVHEGVGFGRFGRGLEVEFEVGGGVGGGERGEGRGGEDAQSGGAMTPGGGSVRGIGRERRLLQVCGDGMGGAVNEKVDGGGDGVEDGDLVDQMGDLRNVVLEVNHLSAQFPGPTTPREFVVCLLRCVEGGFEEDDMFDGNDQAGDTKGQTRQMTVISRPVTDHPSCPENPQRFVRGQYQSVEFIREIPGGGEGKPAAVEWIMISRSDPGGNVPRWMVERGTPNGIVRDAERFLEWVRGLSDEELMRLERKAGGGGMMESGDGKVNGKAKGRPRGDSGFSDGTQPSYTESEAGEDGGGIHTPTSSSNSTVLGDHDAERISAPSTVPLESTSLPVDTPITEAPEAEIGEGGDNTAGAVDQATISSSSSTSSTLSLSRTSSAASSVKSFSTCLQSLDTPAATPQPPATPTATTVPTATTMTTTTHHQPQQPSSSLNKPLQRFLSQKSHLLSRLEKRLERNNRKRSTSASSSSASSAPPTVAQQKQNARQDQEEARIRERFERDLGKAEKRYEKELGKVGREVGSSGGTGGGGGGEGVEVQDADGLQREGSTASKRYKRRHHHHHHHGNNNNNAHGEEDSAAAAASGNGGAVNGNPELAIDNSNTAERQPLESEQGLKGKEKEKEKEKPKLKEPRQRRRTTGSRDHEAVVREVATVVEGLTRKVVELEERNRVLERENRALKEEAGAGVGAAGGGGGGAQEGLLFPG